MEVPQEKKSKKLNFHMTWGTLKGTHMPKLASRMTDSISREVATPAGMVDLA